MLICHEAHFFLQYRTLSEFSHSWHKKKQIQRTVYFFRAAKWFFFYFFFLALTPSAPFKHKSSAWREIIGRCTMWLSNSLWGGKKSLQISIIISEIQLYIYRQNVCRSFQHLYNMTVFISLYLQSNRGCWKESHSLVFFIVWPFSVPLRCNWALWIFHLTSTTATVSWPAVTFQLKAFDWLIK